VTHTAARLAELRGTDLARVSALTTENAAKVFRLAVGEDGLRSGAA
jgi:Tat protein secretion system quality control protein TatD with DNase activity